MLFHINSRVNLNKRTYKGTKAHAHTSKRTQTVHPYMLFSRIHWGIRGIIHETYLEFVYIEHEVKDCKIQTIKVNNAVTVRIPSPSQL